MIDTYKTANSRHVCTSVSLMLKIRNVNSDADEMIRQMKRR